jgi:hypothetical protein
MDFILDLVLASNPNSPSRPFPTSSSCVLPQTWNGSNQIMSLALSSPVRGLETSNVGHREQSATPRRNGSTADRLPQLPQLSMSPVSPQMNDVLQVSWGTATPLAPCPAANSIHSSQVKDGVVADMVVCSVVCKYQFHNDNEIEMRLFSQVGVSVYSCVWNLDRCFYVELEGNPA